jgi:hypothetical protein
MSRQRIRTNKPAEKTKAPEPPKPPRFYELNDLDRDIAAVPVWLEGNPDKTLENGATDFDSDEQFALLLKPLTMRSYISYRKTFGEPIDSTVAKIFWVFGEMGRLSNLDEGETPDTDMEYDNDGNTVTPFGKLEGNLEEAMVRLVAFVLAQGGRITEENAEGYVTEPVTVEDILDLIQPRAVFKPEESDGSMMFYHILENAGIWRMSEVENRMKEMGEESVGNLPELSAEKPSENDN